MRGGLSVAVAASLAAFTSAIPAENERRIGAAFLDSLAGTLGQDQTFDYVVVGAGNAGIPLAYRLSEDPSVTVALIEAGTFYQIANPFLSSTPAGDVIFAGSSPLDTNPLVDWNFVTQPQTGASNRRIHYARGRCLGGTSARNFMIYQRGTRGSYQKWADDIDDQSYSFDNLLPYFKKSNQFTGPNTSKRAANATVDFNADSFSTTGGPGQVSYTNYAQPFSSYMEAGLNSIGLPKQSGFQDGVLDGTAYCASTIVPKTQKRASSQETFLNAAEADGRRNLKVFSLTMAKRILFDSDKKATGVQVAAGGFLPFVLKARKEVIVSAGAFHSPQLLMVSGIGPANQLEPLGIPIVHENPNVGQNMWDHIFAGPSYQMGMTTFTRLANDPLYLAAQGFKYFTTQSGPLTSPVSDFLGWEKIPSSFYSQLSSKAKQALSEFPEDWPELEYISGAGYVGDFSNLMTNQPGKGTKKQYGTILSTLVKPLSRGTVSITSADTNVLPIIDPKWLSDPTDQEVAIIAFKRARQAFQTAEMQRGVVGEEFFPGANVATDEQILQNYRDTLMTVWHPACTCKMGKADDPTAVVDPKARVIGVKNLRVVDASAFNLLPPGRTYSSQAGAVVDLNTLDECLLQLLHPKPPRQCADHVPDPMSTVYALAEKIADDIKNDNR